LRGIRTRERIGLPDQSREFGQGITFGPPMLIVAAAMIVGREGSILMSISHRGDASPMGKVVAPVD
jgi:hypothetical protein